MTGQSSEPDATDDQEIGFDVTTGKVTMVVFVVFNSIAVLCGLLGESFGTAFVVAAAVSGLIVGILAWPIDPLP